MYFFKGKLGLAGLALALGLGLSMAGCAMVMGDIHYNRGRSALNNSNYEGAVAAFTSSLNSAPNSPGFEAVRSNTLNRRGEAHAAMGNYGSAIADFNAALSLNPNNNAARDNLARIRGH